MTDHTRFQDDLKAYADGELSWLRRAAVRRHLTHCASCQKEITAMTQISDDLRSDDLRAAEPGEPLPPSLREKILAAPGTGSAGLPGESHSVTEDTPLRVKSRRLPAWTFAAVALVAWFAFYPLYQKTRQQAVMTRNLAMTSPTAPMALHPPVRVAQAENAAPTGASNNTNPFDKPTPPAMQADISEPTRAKAPPPPPEMVNAPSAVHRPSVVPPMPERAASQSRVVYGGFGLESLNHNSNSNVLNGDPDSLRQVHKEASIGIQVSNPEATGDKLNQMVQETGGYVAANNLSTGTDGLRSGELIVKVPEPQFETFLAAVAKLGVVVSKNVTGQDITEKTSDAHEAQDVEESDLTQAEARLKALGTHAKWEDTQNAEDLRVQLAQTRARLKLLKRMAALGTLTIDLSQTPKAAAAPPVTNGFTGSLKATTHDALQSLVGSAGALLALVIWLLAYAPLWVPLLLLGRYALKEYGKREVV